MLFARIVTIARASWVSEPFVGTEQGKCSVKVDDAPCMEHAGFRRPVSRSNRPEDPGCSALRHVAEIDRRLCALRDALYACDAAHVHALAKGLADNAHEEADCNLIGLEDDDGLADEMQLSRLLERAEDLIAFCRMAMPESHGVKIDHDARGDDAEAGSA